MKKQIYRYFRRFIWCILFSGITGCLEPVSPPLEPITDIYIGCVLKTGKGPQRVYVYQSVTDPAATTPGGSALLIQDAVVSLRGDDFETFLAPAWLDSTFQMSGPYFSTGPIEILPETTYELSVRWQGKAFTARTTTPVTPVFQPIDTSEIIISEDEFGLSGFSITWTSPFKNHSLVADYPSERSWRWGGNGRAQETNFVTGYSFNFFTYWWDSSGVAYFTVYSRNEDYEKSEQSGAELANVGIPQQYYSNIQGAHGVFAAMSASDTRVLKYRKE